MKTLYLILALVIGSANGFTQVTKGVDDLIDDEKKLKKVTTDSTDGWQRGGLVNINFTQVSLTNWAAGGQNSISLAGFSSLFANYKQGKSTWDNTLVMQFGQVKQGGNSFVKNLMIGFNLRQSMEEMRVRIGITLLYSTFKLNL